MPQGPLSLSPMEEALNQILLPTQFDPKNCFVVAGTNGKGSVCATLETLFFAAGKRVGLYTSPHLEDTTERIRINKREISRNLFKKTFHEVRRLTKGKNFTHFEFLTLMAAYLFYSGRFLPPVEIAIFEVGLGGTWDATNAIPHKHCVITSIGLDHEAILGSTLEEIAPNKWGIIGNESKVTYSPLPSCLIPLAKDYQRKTATSWVPTIPFEFTSKLRVREPKFFLSCQWGKACINLPGLRGAENTATALTAFHEYGFDPKPYLTELRKVRWPGRMEKVNLSSSPCPIYLSGDHNPLGIESLLEILPHYPRSHLHIIVGITLGKSIKGILAPLTKIPDSSIYFTQSPFRGIPPDGCQSEWGQSLHTIEKDPKKILNRVLKRAQAEDMILITGSLYLVGFYKSHLRKLQK